MKFDKKIEEMANINLLKILSKDFSDMYQKL